MRRLELHLTYRCTESCAFCSEATRMAAFQQFPVTLGRVARVLVEQARRGITSLHLTGGEPTLHPQFLEVLHLARRLGMRTSVGTIGVRLADPDFAARALPRLDEVMLSVHGPDAGVHDALTGRAGSFERALRAAEVARAVRPGLRLSVNTVLTRQSLPGLLSTVRLARDRIGAGLLLVSNVAPEGAAIEEYGALAVRLDELRSVAEDVVAEAGPTMVVRFFGTPLCTLGEAWKNANDLHWDPRVTVEWVRHPGRVSLDAVYSWKPTRMRKQGPRCPSCLYRPVCGGVFREYVKRHGWEEVRPVG